MKNILIKEYNITEKQFHKQQDKICKECKEKDHYICKYPSECSKVIKNIIEVFDAKNF